MIRSREGLVTAAEKLAAVRTDAHRSTDVVAAPQAAEWETTNVHQVATVLTEAALLRDESRGGHFRTDFPAVEPTWARRIEITLGADGELRLARGRQDPAEGSVGA
ncbi:hypothetical protein NKG05_18265 [Oerskovia sp. M15]